MAKLLKLRRGTTSQHSSFTGAEGEVTVDTDKDVLVVNDGSTAGGHPLAAEDMSNVSAANIKGRLGTTLTNAEINGSAAIAGTKISPDFGSQNVSMGEKLTLSATTPNIEFTDTNHNPDYRIKTDNGAFTIEDAGDNSDKFVINSDGHIDVIGNLDVGAGVDVTGDIVATGDIKAQGGDIRIEGSQPGVHFTDTNNNDDFLLYNNNGILKVYDSTDGADRFTINSSGTVGVNGNLDVGAGIDVTGNITATGNVTTNGDIFVSSAYPRIHLTDTDNNSDYLFVNDNGNFRIFDVTNNTSRFTVESSGLTKVHGNLDALAGVDVTGNITVSGTVDGRDVASDGSKLDGIESSATADQTASEILTLIKTVDGSGSGLDADTLDGMGSSSFLRADAADTATGDITFQGGAAAVNIAAGSDIRFTSGSWTGEACKIQHNSNILYIQGGSASAYNIAFRSNAGSDRLYMSGDGDLYPAGNGTQDLGTTNNRFANIYTSDLHLSNEAKGMNNIDGTWGDWTIVEGESDLFLSNNRSGKKYKFNLTEVS